LVKKRRDINETITSVVVDGDLSAQPKGEAQDLSYMLNVLEDLFVSDQVIGYILRNQHTATVDLKNPADLMRYATLSYEALNAAGELSILNQMGKVEKILVEGKEVKMLCVSFGENTLSLFMENSVDHIAVLNRILPLTQ
jgi:predicted regulator of Ras-like GTPase activity (Roadblock/LC7/MglB family)